MILKAGTIWDDPIPETLLSHIDLKRLEILWVDPKVGTSMGRSQKLELLWLDLKRLELLWANPRSWKFYGQISTGLNFSG